MKGANAQDEPLVLNAGRRPSINFANASRRWSPTLAGRRWADNASWAASPDANPARENHFNAAPMRPAVDACMGVAACVYGSVIDAEQRNRNEDVPLKVGTENMSGHSGNLQGTESEKEPPLPAWPAAAADPATSVPEPSAYAAMLLGIASMSVFIRRKRSINADT